MCVVPKERAGVGSAVNDATCLFGATLGVAVIGSIAASLCSSRLGATIPNGLPADVALSAKGSVGGALVAAQDLGRSGLAASAGALSLAAVGAFLPSFAGRSASVAIGGGFFAAGFLPARPTRTLADEPVSDVVRVTPLTNMVGGPVLEIDGEELEGMLDEIGRSSKQGYEHGPARQPTSAAQSDRSAPPVGLHPHSLTCRGLVLKPFPSPPRGENGEKRWSRDDSGSLSPISLLFVLSDVRSDTDRFDHAIEWHLGTPAERFHFHLARGLEQEQREPIGR